MSESSGSPTAQTGRRARTEPPEQVDVAVVGAGPGGLAAAARLAAAGLRVAVFDGHYVAGGCATQFARKGPHGRYRFDVGLHYIGDCGPQGMIPRIVAGLGAQVEYLPMDPHGFDTLVLPDFRFEIPADVDLYRDRLVEQFPRERRGIDRYMRLLREFERLMKRMDHSAGRMTWQVGMKTLLRSHARL